jgi:hypothetical protein
MPVRGRVIIHNLDAIAARPQPQRFGGYFDLSADDASVPHHTRILPDDRQTPRAWLHAHENSSLSENRAHASTRIEFAAVP